MLIDDMLQQAHDPARHGIVVPNAKLGDALRHAYVIKAQNVADYLYESSPKDQWDFENDFPDVAPPIPSLWFEWRLPRFMNLEGKIKTNPNMGFLHGVLLNSVDLSSIPKAHPAAGIRWLCNAFFFGKPQSDSGICCYGSLSWYVKADGQIYRPEGKWLVGLGSENKDAMQPLTDFMTVALYVPLLTLSFMHCKNVETIPGPAWEPEIQKARIRRGKLPLVRWHTVVIDPVKKAVAAANGGDSRLTPQALHICRGHWKKFEGKGLFGRHFGRYWWPGHKRGSIEHGIVLKDYLVKGAKSDEQPNQGKSA